MNRLERRMALYRQAANNVGGVGMGDSTPPHTVTELQAMDWTIAELACYTYSMVSVPLYDTLGTEAISYIIEKASISTIVCDRPEKVKLLLDCATAKDHSIKTIIVIDSFDTDLIVQGEKHGIEVLSMKEVEPPKSSDLAVICFTSGTTGNPKGAMITHGNVVGNASGFIKMTERLFMLTAEDVLISFLPLAHMFERVVECVILCHGARIGFFQGDIRLLMDDLKTLQPTIFPVVPRLLNRMFDRIFGQANTPLKRWILDFASKRKEAELRSGVVRSDSMWDKLIFSKVQASLGGKVRLMITGAAPVSPTVLTFLRAALGCQFYEGYGQTECTAGCTLTLPGDWTAGHVGAPMPCSVLKLVDVPDMNYFSANGEGEVCVRGPCVFKGYLNDPEKTAEALDKDGWLHTGDIGKWLPNGTLKIIDRKKHIFKLAQGEYIAPEKIENIYLRSEPVAQIFVHGDSLQACLVAIVVPDFEVFPEWAKKKGFESSMAELCKQKELKNAILEDLSRLGKSAGLKSFEQEESPENDQPPSLHHHYWSTETTMWLKVFEPGSSNSQPLTFNKVKEHGATFNMVARPIRTDIFIASPVSASGHIEVTHDQRSVTSRAHINHRMKL
ncbi:ACSL1 ligase, partial [Polypterus senegalus]